MRVCFAPWLQDGSGLGLRPTSHDNLQWRLSEGCLGTRYQIWCISSNSSNFISDKIHENTHTHIYIYIIHVYIFIYTYNTFTVVNTQNVHMYCVSACQKKAEAYWAGCRIIHKEPYRIYPIEYEHDFNMLFCCGFCWLSVTDGSTWLIYLYSLGCFPIRRIV